MVRVIINTGLLFLVLLGACNQENSWDCVQKSGPMVSKVLPLPAFDTLEVHDDIDLRLVRDSLQMVIYHGGKNLLTDIEAEVSNGRLVLRNHNSCRWVRNYDQVWIEIHYSQLAELDQKSYGKVDFTDTVKQEKLIINVESGTGDVTLNVNTNYLSVVSNDVANVKIGGSTQLLEVGYYYNLGRFEGRDLQARWVKIIHQGENDLVVRASESITGEIDGRGNVIYYGNPSLLEFKINGSGQLIAGPPY